MIPAELNDAAFIVVQLEPTELDDIKALRDTLRHFAVFDPSASPPVRAHAQHAATQLNLILLGAGDDAAALLASASTSIEAAVKAAEETDRGEVRVTLTDMVAITRNDSDGADLAAAMDAGTETVTAVAPAPKPAAAPAAVALVELPPMSDGGTIPDDADLSLLADFIAESRESMNGAEAALLALEANPEDIEAVNTVFRAFHTVKGTAAFMGLDQLAEFAHHAESLLSRVRDRELEYTQAVADLSLRSNDVLGEFLDAVEKSVQSHESIALPSDYRALMHDLLNVDAVLSGTQAPISVGMPPAVVSAETSSAPRAATASAATPAITRAGSGPSQWWTRGRGSGAPAGVRRPNSVCACAPTASTASSTWSASW